MRLIIVRHAESEGNVSGVVQGGSDFNSGLTAVGREQADKLRDRLADQRIDLAYTSPLERARHTAEAILERHPGVELVATDRLKEKDTGEFAGRPRHELRRAWEVSGLSFGEFQPKGGESWNQAGERVLKFIKEIVDQYKSTDLNILVVGHGSIFTYLLAWADGLDPKAIDREKYDHYHPSNTAVTEIDVSSAGALTLVSLDDTSHLKA